MEKSENNFFGQIGGGGWGYRDGTLGKNELNTFSFPTLRDHAGKADSNIFHDTFKSPH